MQVRLVPSADNLADRLTRFPAKWLRFGNVVGSAAGAITASAAVTGAETVGAAKVTLNDIQAIHDRCHFGVDKTLDLVKERFVCGVSRKMVKKVVSHRDRCARIDPAVTFRWEQCPLLESGSGGHLISPMSMAVRISLSSTQRWGSLMWRRSRSESAQEVAGQFRQLFAEFGPPESILTDNGTVYHNRDLEHLLQHWEVAHDFSCAYRPQGNGAVERVHRTVKRSAARAGATVEDIVFWLNNSSADGKVSPYELCFVRVRGNPVFRPCVLRLTELRLLVLLVQPLFSICVA